jgi:TolB protein
VRTQAVVITLLAALACSGDTVSPPPELEVPPAEFQLLVERLGLTGVVSYELTDLDGTHVTPFAALPDSADTLTPSPDGRRIAFLKYDATKAVVHLVTMARDGSAPRVVQGGDQWVSSPSWSPDGARITFTNNTLDLTDDIWVVNADGSGAVDLTPDPLPGVWFDRMPAWSPDGRRIAFSSNRSGTTRIWTMNADGSNPTLLPTLDSAAQVIPAWSPDGARLAWLSIAPHNSFGISVARPDGSGFVQFPLAGAVRLTTWLPDGRIAFASNQTGSFDIYALDPATGTTTDLTQQPGDEVWAAVLRRVAAPSR